MDFSKLLEEYLQSADVQRDCTLSGNYKRGNIAATKLEKINQQLMDATDTAAVHRFIDSILSTENPNAIMWVSSVCQQKQYQLNAIIQKVTAYSTDETLGILSFNAKMLLKQITSRPSSR